MADAGRVIAGTARGVRLAAPGEGTRPLGDRVKQTLFGILEPRPRGRARSRDLFAGSGAGAIEALSRGAARAVLVEKDGGRVPDDRGEPAPRRASRTGRGSSGATSIAWLADPAGAAAGGPFDLVLVDPPYADTAGARARARARRAAPRPGRRRRREALLAGRAARRASVCWPSERERRFGETALTFYRPADPARDEEAGEA